jgi:uncharacterized LabA/DUF88 family protein
MMLEDDLENRFDKVYLASGDGGLAPFAQSLLKKGVALEVVSAPWSLSIQYRFLGAEVSYLWPDYELAA